MAKALTRDQLQGRKEKAVRFLRDVLLESDRAREVEDESLEDYAARRKIRLLNPSKRRLEMARGGPTKTDLDRTLQEISGLADEALDPENSREEIVRRLKDIADLADGDSESDGTEDDEDEEDEGDD